MPCHECERLQDMELKTMLDYARHEPTPTGAKQQQRLKLLERKLREAERASLRHQSEHLRTRKAA
jgi:hypothetical protein